MKRAFFLFHSWSLKESLLALSRGGMRFSVFLYYVRRREWPSHLGIFYKHRPIHPIHSAVWWADVPLLKCLIRTGFDLNPRNEWGNTPLMAALIDHTPEREKAALLLIQAGANIKIRNKQGQAPLFLAIQRGRAHLVETLLAAGADPFSVHLPVSPHWSAHPEDHLLAQNCLAVAQERLILVSQPLPDGVLLERRSVRRL